jgi:hypothetical protein
MSNSDTTRPQPITDGVVVGVSIDPFADPVAYLADLGIEATLIAHIGSLPEAA